jgi:hypothetical protein
LDWLPHFAATPVTDEKRWQLFADVYAFCWLGGSVPVATWRKFPVRNFALWAEHSPGLMRKRWLEIESLQTITRDALLAAAEREPLRLPKLSVALEIDFSGWTVSDKRPNSPQFWITPPSGVQDSLFGVFVYRLASILAVNGDQIARCPSLACKQPLRLFVRIKSDQLFCSNTCRSREAMKKWREEKAQGQRKKKIRTVKKTTSHTRRMR